MKPINNEKGIALVMVLILAVIALMIVSAVIFMVTQGTLLSGGHRFFRTAEEASLGGTEIATEFIKSRGSITPGLSSSWVSTDPCLSEKLNLSKTSWTTNCDANEKSLDAATSEDMRFDLGNFRVFAKIVDTVEGNSDTAAGNLITGGGELGGDSVVSSTSGIVSPSHNPYLYRMEVQAQDINNPRERSRLSVLYAY